MVKSGVGNLAHACVYAHELVKAGGDGKGVGPPMRLVDGVSVVIRDRKAGHMAKGDSFSGFLRKLSDQMR